jgi:N-acetylmuramoyl-L-alanine amidase
LDTAVSANEIANRFKKEQKIVLRTSEVLFKIQFASSDVMLDLKKEKFSNIIDADFYKVGNILKYTSGAFSNMKDAATHQNFLREKGFADCFVIAFKDGKRIDMAEARTLMEANKSK